MAPTPADALRRWSCLRGVPEYDRPPRLRQASAKGGGGRLRPRGRGADRRTDARLRALEHRGEKGRDYGMTQEARKPEPGEAGSEAAPRSESGIPLKPYYDSSDSPAQEPPPPGDFPFTRGVYPDMYRGR